MVNSSHFDERGNARMVDVSTKPVTVREAKAQSRIIMSETTAERIRSGEAKKGDVLGVAQLAAIQASKLTSTLIPLCHAIPIEAVDVTFEFIDGQTLACTSVVRTTARTGVEMEALTACSIGALTVYDMCKSMDRGMQITCLRLLNKSGGQGGDYARDADE